MSRYGTAGRFLLLCAVWGTAFMATDVGLADLLQQCRSRPCASTSLPRCCSPPFSPPARTSAPDSDDYVYVLVGGALIIGAHHAFLFAGQRYVTGGVAAVLLGLVPVVTPALTRLVSTDEEFTVTTALGVVLGFVGVVVIADPAPRISRTASSVCRSCLRLRSRSPSPRSSRTVDRRRCRSSPRRRG